jgi:hypothetical protein
MITLRIGRKKRVKTHYHFNGILLLIFFTRSDKTRSVNLSNEHERKEKKN